MIVEVRYFASLAERTGASAETLEIPETTTLDGLWARILERHPGLTGVPRPLTACDRVYAEADRGLAGVQEVAFLPPVSGG